MSHSLIVGITDTGKSTLAKMQAQVYRDKGHGVLVLDPFKSPEWGADYITNKADQFLKVVESNTRCGIFVDESGDMIGRYAGVMKRLATHSRHRGHNAHFITQRVKMLDINIRTQCSNIFLFKQSQMDAKELANEFVAPELLKAQELKKGEFLAKIGVDDTVTAYRLMPDDSTSALIKFKIAKL